MNEVKFYEVGGAVRDSLLGVQSKDIDLVCEAPSFEVMVSAVEARGGKIYQPRPQYFTIRCKMPYRGESRDVDVVLARKEGFYSDGRRPDSVQIGTIYNDLARRDFTVNAMARDEDGNLLDPHDGREDLRNMRLRCVGNTRARFTEDSLRLCRAIRFHITRGFGLDDEIIWALRDWELCALLKNASIERVRDELVKCFAHDTLRTLSFFDDYTGLRNVIFHKMTARGLWLTPTLAEA